MWKVVYGKTWRGFKTEAEARGYAKHIRKTARPGSFYRRFGVKVVKHHRKKKAIAKRMGFW